MELMARYEDNHFDLAIVDPPYGIDIAKWDEIDMKPNEEYFKELFRVSKNQIIWGANYFHLPHSQSWICWHKLDGLGKGLGTTSEFELAWTSHNNKAKEGDKILDTHLGSGSIAIACHNLKFDLTACELDKEYFDSAMKRINNHTAQLRII